MELLNKKAEGNNNIVNINNKNEMIIIYKIKQDKYEIKLFGKKFIENNKNNCKIIIDNKDQDLIEYLKINKNERILKIKLKEIKAITNMSYMFYECNH